MVSPRIRGSESGPGRLAILLAVLVLAGPAPAEGFAILMEARGPTTGSPAFDPWPTPPPGLGQVNVAYDYQPDRSSFGTNMFPGVTWIGSLAFHIDDPDAVSQIALSLTAGEQHRVHAGGPVRPRDG
jgi:hypothetical protein